MDLYFIKSKEEENEKIHFFHTSLFYFFTFLLCSKYLNDQKATSTTLRILMPVNKPKIPPKAESLSKKLSLLLLTVTETVSVASLKITSAL